MQDMLRGTARTRRLVSVGDMAPVQRVLIVAPDYSVDLLVIAANLQYRSNSRGKGPSQDLVAVDGR